MANISNIIYSKYVQATNALNEYAIKVSSNLGSGIKSKQRMRKLNLMSSWLDLLGTYIRKPKFFAGSSVPSFRMSNIIAPSNELVGVFINLYISSTNQNFMMGGNIISPNEGYNMYSEIYGIFKSQQSDHKQLPSVVITKNDINKSITFKFPNSEKYNGATFGVYGGAAESIKIDYEKNGNNPFEGGSDPSAEIIAYNDIPEKQMLEKLDIIAAELGIVYNLSEDLSETI